MRIIHIVNRVSDRGDGIANVCVDLACEQASTGDDVWLASGPGGFVPLCESRGVTHRPLDLLWRSPGDVVSSVRALKRILDEARPDVLHCHTMRAVLVARLAVGRGGPKIVATVHNEYQRGAILMGLADRVVGVSKAVSKAMSNRRISTARISTVPNGTVGSARSDAPAGPAPDLAPRSIVAVGAVSERKGADVLIGAFERIANRHPDAHLYFVGNVDWDEATSLASASVVADRVHFAGFSAHPRSYLDRATVFALASRRDPFPLVLLEALDAGVPIVATSVDGIPEALDGGTAGIIVPPDDADEFGAALDRLLDSPDLRARYSEAARHRSGAYSVSKMTAGYRGVYESLLARPIPA